MSSLYNIIPDHKAYKFDTDYGHTYTVYFTQYFLTTLEGEEIEVIHFGFARNGSYENELFKNIYDEKIKNTILSIIDIFFEKNPHSTLIFFCYNNDGFGRHRKIIFRKWGKELSADIFKYDRAFGDNYAAILTKNENPQKDLIVDAFNFHIDDLFS